MRHGITLYRILIFLAILFASLPVLAGDYYVRQGGDDQADGKTAATAFRTLVRAGQVLNHGDQVIVGPGTYRETVFIAERYGTPAVRLAITGDESGKMTGDAAGAVILEPASADAPALRFRHSEHITLSGLTLRGPGLGLSLEKCRNVVVARSTFDGLASGLSSKVVEGLDIESCVFSRCVIGASLRETSRTRVEHVTVASCSTAGLLLSSCGPGTIQNSVFAQNVSAYIADETAAQNWTCDYNALGGGGVGPWGDVQSIGFPYQWPSASGQDWHSLYLTPIFADPEHYDLHINPTVTWAGGLPGMYAGTAPAKTTVLDRDGKPFRVREGTVSVGAYDYPDPIAGPGWQQLNSSLKGAGPRQSAGIYLADGTLVRMLLTNVTGVRDLWWDGLDDLGQPAMAGKYEIRSVEHDVRLLNEGEVGNNSNPAGFCNPYSPLRAVGLPDGGFFLSAQSETGMGMRRYSATGQSLCASFFSGHDYWGLACWNNSIIGGIKSGNPVDPASVQLVRHNLSGTRALMATGERNYPLYAPGEKGGAPAGLTVVGDIAYVSIPALNVVRCIDLKMGKPLGDWPLAGIGEITAGADGQLWALQGTDIVALDSAGHPGARFATTLTAPTLLAAGNGQLAALDMTAQRLVVLNSATGAVIRTFGKTPSAGAWMPMSLDTLRSAHGITFLATGALLLLETHRLRACWPENGKIAFDASSLFGNPVVTNPAHPDYAYGGEGIFHLDPATGAWTWVAEAPLLFNLTPADEAKIAGMPYSAALLRGRPFMLCRGGGREAPVNIVDVSDPLQPRLALSKVERYPSYYCFGPHGDLVRQGSGLEVATIKFTGLDANNNPTYDFDHPSVVGQKKDVAPRNMQWTWSGENRLVADTRSGDVYHLANTAHYPVTVAYFRGGTGVTKSNAAGKPLWYVKGWDSFYMGLDCVNDGKRAWVFAGDWIGGGPDVLDSDGLWITSGNLGWPSSYSGGMMDYPWGSMNAYLRADGKVGVNTEEDWNGRSLRYRLDDAETLRKKSTPLEWKTAAATAGTAPTPQKPGGAHLPYFIIPKVAPLKIDGDWRAWRKAGGWAQILDLPCNVTFNRGVPEDLMLTLANCTTIGSIVHDEKNFYVYFLVADDTLQLEATQSGGTYAYDGIEFFLEQEQFCMGILKGGTPNLHKARQHNRDKTDYAGHYQMPNDFVWAQTVDNLGAHPLGQELAAMTGISMEGKRGYAVMAKIPYEEVKLVTGAGHPNGITDMTGAAGEVVRAIVMQGCAFTWGGFQDAKISWPPSQCYFDANRSVPMVLGPYGRFRVSV